jgi:hypothetical protein
MASTSIAVVQIDIDTSPAPNPAVVVQAVAGGGLVVAQQPALLSDLNLANQVLNQDLAAKGQLTQQNAMNRLRTSILAQAVQRVQGPGPASARAAVAVLTGQALAETLASLGASVATPAASQATASRARGTRR